MALPIELPQPGAVLGGKYRIERVLGEGVMGVVYEAVHARLGQRVAIKLPQPSIMAEPVLAERFEREARAAARLRHRNSVRVMDVDVTENGLPYMVMELLHGHDLETEVTARGPLPIGESVALVLQACSAMHEAHGRGIVHRDLKPSNLFLANEADGTVCLKILDFGISKMQSENVRITSTQVQMGTPLYMSPEQVRSVKDVDRRTDIWSLGVILYELLSGQPPFMGSATGIGAAIVSDIPTSLHDLRPEIPEELEAAIGKAMAKKPTDRYASMQEMVLALAPFSDQALPAEILRMSVTRHPDPALGSLGPSSLKGSFSSAIGSTSLTGLSPSLPGASKSAAATLAQDATGMSLSLTQTRKSSKRRMFVVVGAVLLVAGIGAAAFGAHSMSKAGDPRDTATRTLPASELPANAAPPAPMAGTANPAPTNSTGASAPEASSATAGTDKSKSIQRPHVAVAPPVVQPRQPPRAPAPLPTTKPPESNNRKGWDNDSPLPPP